MNICSTQENCTTERDACIIEMLEEIKSMVYNFSRKYSMDYDDCYQHASLLMLQVYPTIPNGYNVKAYLNAAVRRGLYQLLRNHIDYSTRSFSLEATRNEDGATLSDVLEASEPYCAEARLQRAEKVTEAVHSALSLCRIEEQEYACMVFELPDYTPVAPVNSALNHKRNEDKPRRTDNMLRSVKRIFRKHPQIQGLIQRETCVL